MLEGALQYTGSESSLRSAESSWLGIQPWYWYFPKAFVILANSWVWVLAPSDPALGFKEIPKAAFLCCWLSIDFTPILSSWGFQKQTRKPSFDSSWCKKGLTPGYHAQGFLGKYLQSVDFSEGEGILFQAVLVFTFKALLARWLVLLSCLGQLQAEVVIPARAWDVNGL